MKSSLQGWRAFSLAAVTLTALCWCHSVASAGIGKVDCHDQPVPLPRLLFDIQLPHCNRPHYPNYNNEFFGYYRPQWRLWPGTAPNQGQPSKASDSKLPQPTRIPASSEMKQQPPRSGEAGD
jgi:hypothetical protein